MSFKEKVNILYLYLAARNNYMSLISRCWFNENVQINCQLE